MAAAADTSPVTPDALVYDVRTASQPALSPDGARVAYVVSGNGRATGKAFSQLWLVGLDGGEPRQLTFAEVSHGAPAWSPDGTQLAFVAGREDGGGRLCILSMDGGDPREVTAHRASPHDLAWSPDGQTVAYIVNVDPANPGEAAADPEALAPVRVVTRADYKLDGRGYLGDTHDQLWVVDVGSGTRRQLTADAMDRSDPEWSPDGKTLGVSRVDRTRYRLSVGMIDLVSGAERVIGTPAERIHAWQWSPDGASLLIQTTEHYSVGGQFSLVDVASGTRRALTPMDAWDPYLDYGGGLRWVEGTTAILSGFSRSACGLWTLDTTSGEIAQVCLDETYETGTEMVAGSSLVVRTWSGPDGLGELVARDIRDGSLRRLTHLNDAFVAAHPAGAIERVSTTNEGLAIESLLTKPAGFDPARRYPLIVFVHGGPHMCQTFGYVEMNQLFAGAGYLVLSPNPRGSISYGTDFAKGCIGDWGGGDWRDIVAALDAALALPYVDAERTAIYGYSYGGYMSSWAIGQTGRFRAAVIGAPITDLISRYGTADIGYPIGNDEYDGEVPEIFDRLVERSPMTHVHKASTPTLILHPEEDHRCPIGQGEQLFIGLLKAGVPVEFVRYPGQSHLMPWGGPARYREDFYTRVLGWMAQYL